VIANAHASTSEPRTWPRLWIIALLATAGLVALSGCGSSKSSTTTSEATTTSAPPATTSTSTTPTTGATGTSSSGGGPTLALAANKEGQLAFTSTSLSAKAGNVTIAFTNSASLPHNVTVESASGEKLGQTETFSGGTKNLTLNLKSGTYKFFCSVPGHRQAGMEGTLTVK
jgi:plastocyanin